MIEHSHDSGWCSITGGYVVRDSHLGSLQGKYVYGDFCKGKTHSATLKPGWGDWATARSAADGQESVLVR